MYIIWGSFILHIYACTYIICLCLIVLFFPFHSLSLSSLPLSLYAATQLREYSRRKETKTVPKGASDYQASWIIDEGGERGESEEEEDDDDEEEYYQDSDEDNDTKSLVSDGILHICLSVCACAWHVIFIQSQGSDILYPLKGKVIIAMVRLDSYDSDVVHIYIQT